MSIKLVAIDIDGTLLNNDRQITPKVRAAIQAARAAGVYVVLCTGRPLPGVADLLADLEMNTANDFVITYNGSLVQNVASGDIIVRYGMTLADYIEVEMLARKNGVHFHAINHESIYTPNRDIGKYSVHEATLVNMPLKYRTPEEMTEEIQIIKMMMIDDKEILDAVIPKLPADFTEKYTAVRSTEFYYEILNKEAHKGNGLAALAKHLGIQQAETMAIGDNENDLAMIEYAGMGIAVGNATANVKAAAQATVASNQEDGVAEAFTKFVL
ncbi:Cof subfamily protein (haloacid dehalogenase superfamily) [Enterococcus sp. PF1-24]|uniref:sugar-phosphatase n=1 Tax=unclassified Enterococcus TaxID=2608891 RepID=UPI002473BCD8|nr:MULTISPECIES: sugar-phosphatase [unclassified Enterococcus]MDH6364773.1 Cof subfamily protein (haloacid dehalogenase superfamily) [Enterococcus sp. PFB1-1]MDH6401882.1 Cof subfamily protein (haloacid dehalogenase superfamily) [Enterococcus sp. PF1-24]